VVDSGFDMSSPGRIECALRRDLQIFDHQICIDRHLSLHSDLDCIHHVVVVGGDAKICSPEPVGLALFDTRAARRVPSLVRDPIQRLMDRAKDLRCSLEPPKQPWNCPQTRARALIQSNKRVVTIVPAYAGWDNFVRGRNISKTSERGDQT
jgi:hypothetical protein